MPSPFPSSPSQPPATMPSAPQDLTARPMPVQPSNQANTVSSGLAELSHESVNGHRLLSPPQPLKNPLERPPHSYLASPNHRVAHTFTLNQPIAPCGNGIPIFTSYTLRGDGTAVLSACSYHRQSTGACPHAGKIIRIEVTALCCALTSQNLPGTNPTPGIIPLQANQLPTTSSGSSGASSRSNVDGSASTSLLIPSLPPVPTLVPQKRPLHAISSEPSPQLRTSHFSTEPVSTSTATLILLEATSNVQPTQAQLSITQLERIIAQQAHQKLQLHGANVGLQSHNDRLLATLAKLEADKAYLKAANFGLQSDIAKFRVANANLAAESANLRKASTHLRSANYLLQSHNDSLRATIANLEAAKSRDVPQNATLEADSASLRETETCLQTANSTLQTAQTAQKQQTLEDMQAVRLEDQNETNAFLQPKVTSYNASETDPSRYTSIAVQATSSDLRTTKERSPTTAAHDKSKHKMASVLAANRQLQRARKEDKDKISQLQEAQFADELKIAALEDQIRELKAAQASKDGVCSDT